MAVATHGRLSTLANLDTVRAYLQERDGGAPTNNPMPEGISQTDLGNGWRYDVIGWDYAQLYPTATTRPSGLPADGFVVLSAVGDTPEPRETSVIVSAGQRMHGVFVPAGTVMSYAIAAYRHTHVGEARGPSVQTPAWRAVGAGGTAARGALMLGHPWVIHHPQVGEAGGFYTELAGSQTAAIVSARFAAHTPTSATVTILQNGVPLADYSGLVVTTADQSVAPAPVPLQTGDKMTLRIEAIIGNPRRIDLTLFELRAL
jgi:hypothetical protein